MKVKLGNVRVSFEPRDLWVGVYWTAGWRCVKATDTTSEATQAEALASHPRGLTEQGWTIVGYEIQTFICLVPCFPLRLRFYTDQPVPVS